MNWVRLSNSQGKAVVIIGSVMAVVLLLVGGISAGLALRRLDRTIATRSESLSELGRLRSEAQILLQQIRKEEEKLSRTSGVSLVTFTEALVNRVAGQGNLVYLRPLSSKLQDGMQVETMEIKLERQSLGVLLRLCWEIDNAAVPMHITGLRLQRRFDNHALLDITLTMNVYRT